jgi:hypothetical protein
MGVLAWFKAEMVTNLNTMSTVFGHIHHSLILCSHSFSWLHIKCSKVNTFWNWWSLDSIFHLSAAAWWPSRVTGVCSQLVCYYLGNIHHTTLSKIILYLKKFKYIIMTVSCNWTMNILFRLLKYKIFSTTESRKYN